MINRKQLFALLAFVFLGAAIIWFNRADTSKTTNPELRQQLAAGQVMDIPDVAQESGKPVSGSTEKLQSISPTESDNGGGVSAPGIEFPPGPSRELFLSKCTLCHSLRVITMQNDFSRSFWEAEVAKMNRVYHAQISEADSNAIVEYLSTIKR